ncbi:hypothetical protein HH310_41050 [Actinoplanes sp. TBRC 11911]|uniref:hypothetical protein n=1 Tax=Actinoplanes sp. TBRC 11911 TaxID=2729386 RepID=UPI00145C6E01|nr:hypothetical protein [Actinoplanes sp. TBRC 11911]NMO57542.1 hypothetical protein [Actinoplanes sp. TBRC 11911]
MFSRKPAAPDTDLAQADLEARDARDRARAGDWAAARDLIVAAGDDWELRGRRLAVLGDAVADSPQWLDVWEAATPDDPTVAILRASSLMDLAGRARGDRSARATSPEEFREFHRLAILAAEAADRAVALNPLDPNPWVTRMTSMLANGRGRQEEFVAAMGEAVKRDPFNCDAHIMAVTYFCEKWYGSHEQMFAAARGRPTRPPAPRSRCCLCWRISSTRFAHSASTPGGPPWPRRPPTSAEPTWCRRSRRARRSGARPVNRA